MNKKKTFIKSIVELPTYIKNGFHQIHSPAVIDGEHQMPLLLHRTLAHFEIILSTTLMLARHGLSTSQLNST